MKVIKPYTGSPANRCMPGGLIRILLMTEFLLCFYPHSLLNAQGLPEYDEISVYLEMKDLGGWEIDALIKDEELFLPFTSLFDFLKIRNVPSSDLETITGFFIDEEAAFTVSRRENSITYQANEFKLGPNDLIRTETNLYLRSKWFGTIFGLECSFSFRGLTVTISSKLELPLIREMRQEKMRANLSRLRGDIIADTNIGRSYPMFRFGMADWSVISTQETGGRSDTRLNLSLGSMLAGGEATAYLYYNSSDPLTEKQQYYQWRFVNNNFAPLRQVVAGKIQTGALASLYNPVVGIQLTNTPTTYRRSFGTHTISDRTEPGWIVELYINNVLVDFKKADASGFYTFDVPLVYGNSLVKLRFYGPWGEERTREQNINIPYNFLPANTLEYTLSAGLVEDSLASRFSRASVNYGVTRGFTIGGGAEYLSSVTTQPVMPFVKASLRMTGNIILSGEFAPGVRTKGNFSLRLPSNMLLDVNYTWYDKEQKAIFYNYREERKATLSVPLRIGKAATFQRFSVNQIVMPALNKYTTAEWMISGSLFGLNTNLTTYGLIINEIRPYFYSNLSLAWRLPAYFVIMPQAQYSYTENTLLSARLKIEKQLFRNAYLNLSYEHNFKNDYSMAEFGLRYDFSFSQAGASVRKSGGKTSFTEYARGSLISDRRTRFLGTDNRTNVGRGGISVIPFIDLNNNNIKDPEEPKVPGLNLRAGSGRVEKIDRDTTIRIFGLEPYTDCFIDLDPNSFENISWRLPRQSYNVTVDPEILKTLYIPVTVAGEATGSVSLEKDGKREGIGRIIVRIITGTGKPAGTVLSEGDGYFSYFGLVPGDYIAGVDTSQLRKLGMTSEPAERKFTIEGGLDGDIKEGLDFVLKYIKEAASDSFPPITPVIQAVRKDTTITIIHEITEELLTITEDCYAIQVGAFKRRANAELYRRKLQAILPGKDVEVTIEGDWFRVRIFDYKTRPLVDDDIAVLKGFGYNEFWVVKLIAKQQQRLLTEREDTVTTIRETQTRDSILIISPDMAIQVGAFRNEINALEHMKRLSTLLDKKVSIVKEDGWFKVRITGFSSIEEMEKMIPALRMFGVRDIWIMPVRPPQVIVIPALSPEEKRTMEIQKAPVRPGRSVRIITGITSRLAGGEKPPVPEPSIALQVAIFHKESQALRARKRITTKLDLPVEIVKQWDYYHVIVTGFYTREETYEYYPELAGLGYPGVTLITDYKRQNR